MYHDTDVRTTISDRSRFLKISETILTNEQCAKLQISYFEQLEISHSKIDPALFDKLSKSLSKNLKELSIDSVTDTNPTPKLLSVLHCLTNPNYLESLEALSLKNQDIGDSEMSAIASMRGLKKLDLTGNRIKDDDIINLSRMILIRNEGSKQTATAFAHKFQNLNIPGLNSSEAENNAIIAVLKQELPGIFAQFAQETMSGITDLNLSSNQIGDTAVEHIANMEGMVVLNLSHNQIGEGGARHIARMQGIKNLNLCNNQIGNAGAEHLSGMQEMIALNLNLNGIGDIGTNSIANDGYYDLETCQKLHRRSWSSSHCSNAEDHQLEPHRKLHRRRRSSCY